MTKKYDEKCQEIFVSKKECDKMRADLLLNEAKEKSLLLKEKQETNITHIDEKQHEVLLKELNALKSKVIDLNEEKTTLNDKLKCMDQERFRSENELNQFEILIKK